MTRAVSGLHPLEAMKTDLHPVEILIVATMAAAWAVATLARAILRLLASAGTPPEPPEPPEPGATITPPEPPQLAELATMRDALMVETAATLRQITGTRRRCSKWEMVASFLAMPV